MPAISITDLNNAKLDVDHIAAIATSVELTATDRLGHTKSTVAAAIDSIKSFINRSAWAALTVYAGKDLVSESGTWYVCVVPHISSAAFATDAASKWRVYQGITVPELAASYGASLVGNGGETVADSFNALQLSNYAALRAYAGPRKSVYITGYLITTVPSGIAGMFVRDDSDTTSADNGGTIIAASNGTRWKRQGAVATIRHFGALGTGGDDTAAIQLAFDTILSLGNNTNNFTTLEIPDGDYNVTALTLGFITGGAGSAATKDLYYKTIIGHGRINGTNAAGPVLNMEGLLWANIKGLHVNNTSSAVGSVAVKASRSYAVNWSGCRFTGGETAHQLQGNNNNYYGCGFTYAGIGFLITGNTTNCKNNSLLNCDFERNTKYNININRVSGTQPSLVIRDCYIEAHQAGFLAHIRIFNAINITVEKNYLSFIGVSFDGIVFGGTLVTTEYNNSNRIINNDCVINTAGIKVNFMAREAGTAATAMGFPRYANNNIDGLVTADTVLGVTGAYAGSVNSGMTDAINMDGARRSVGIVNFDFSALVGALGTAPTGWTSSSGAAATSVASISDYGYGNALGKTGNTYVKQQIKLRAKTLYKITYYAASSTGLTVPSLQLHNVAITVPKFYLPATATATPTLITGWWFNDTDTALMMLLRDFTGGGGDALFSEIRMVDYTN